MSLKSERVKYKEYQFDLARERTGVPHNYAFHQQQSLHMGFSEEWQVMPTVSLQHEGTLNSCVINSLFLDKRAEPDDPVPDWVQDRRGWVGDSFFEENDNWGSKLWMLRFLGKQNKELLDYAKAWSLSALEWMVDDGIADHHEIKTWFIKAERLGIHHKMFKNNNLIYEGQWQRTYNELSNTYA